MQSSLHLSEDSARVLIVDDLPTNILLLTKILKTIGIDQIFSLTDPLGFDALFEKTQPDLVITDLRMPQRSGEDIIAWLRNEKGIMAPPILVITSDTDMKRAHQALNCGAQDCIKRPFVVEEVAVRVRNLLRLSRLHRNMYSRARYLDQRVQEHSLALHQEIKQRSDAEQELHFQATHDHYSRLPNRQLFNGVLMSLLASLNSGRPKKRPVAVAIFHLYHFNDVNNTLGYRHGDEILTEIALRFHNIVKDFRKARVLDQKNSDEDYRVAVLDRTHFAMLVEGGTVDKLETSIEQVLVEANMPISYQGMSIESPVAAGYACLTPDVESLEDWLRRAHVALDQAIKEKRGVAPYREDADFYSARKLTLVGDLRRAIESDRQLFLEYQLQYDCATGEPCGMEALLRWQHPDHGLITPDEVIAMAEQTGLIRPLTRWVLTKAFHNRNLMVSEGVDLPVSVNLSTRNLWQDDLAEELSRLLHRYDMSPDKLMLEVTETVLMEKTERSLMLLEELDSLGIRIALDDFGTGYSSLAYLKKMPVREVKIDRSFVQDMTTDKDDQVIVSATIAMCQSLGVQVVAEGVEDAETFLLLHRMGCDRIQGYHTARPMSPEALMRFLADDALA